MNAAELFSQNDCDLCGEALAGEIAEMYDPDDVGGPTYVVHADCGLGAGLKVA